jgi:hypothetical protein
MKVIDNHNIQNKMLLKEEPLSSGKNVTNSPIDNFIDINRNKSILINSSLTSNSGRVENFKVDCENKTKNYIQNKINDFDIGKKSPRERNNKLENNINTDIINSTYLNSKKSFNNNAKYRNSLNLKKRRNKSVSTCKYLYTIYY